MKKQLYNAVRLGCVLAFCTSNIFNPQQVTAQVTLTGTSYTQNFDSLVNGMPNGWSVDTGMTNASAGYDVSTTFFLNTPATNTGWGNTTGKFKNVASGIPYTYFADATSTLQIAQSNRALGLRQNATLDKNIGFVLKIANSIGFNNFTLSFNLQSLDSNASRTTTWMVDYGIGNNPVLFTPATTTGTMTTGGNQFSKNVITVNFGNTLDNKTDTICIRIVSLNPTTGANSRATSAIDDYNLSWGNIPPPSHIELLGKTPTGPAVPLSANQLALHFNNLIQSDTGQIDLYKAGNPVPISFTVPSAAVTITDSTAIINGISLENNASYYVLMNEGAFTKQGGTLPNEAIVDTTYWTFSTVDTTPLPQPVPLTVLNETFTNCVDSAMSNFVQYNMAGTKVWHCSIYGHNDSAAVYINGGTAAGVSDSNMDWLVSSAPFDFSSMSQPMLSFWQKSRFEGTVIRELKISTDYITGANPADATWTTLQVQDMSVPPTTDVWSEVTGIDLSAYKATPFYMAFTYGCGTSGAYELTYDDIKVDDPIEVGIFSPSKSNMGIKVLGEASGGLITLKIDLLTSTDLNIQMYDLTGRILYRQDIKGKTGTQQVIIKNTTVPAGLYVIRVMGGGNAATVKTFVR